MKVSQFNRSLSQLGEDDILVLNYDVMYTFLKTVHC